MKKEILIISHFSESEDSITNDRFKFIAEILGEQYSVELITSSFFHTTKQYSLKKQEINRNYKICYIDEPGYSKNVSVKRFISHFIGGMNLKSYLKRRQAVPSLIYCAVPSLSFATIAIGYARRNNIPIIVDIQDLWPESFKMIFNPLGIGEILYYPMKKIADYIYSQANAIVAVSSTYCERAKLISKGKNIFLSIYIGTSFNKFDKIKTSGCRNSHIINLIYIGTLGHSYDLKCAMDAFEIVKKSSHACEVNFLILGDGPLEEEFKNYATNKGLEIEFKGRLEYEEMVCYLKKSHIALNPINGKSVASIINKHADYAAAGLPVISTQNSQEYKELLQRYQAGFNCKSGDYKQIAKYILYLLENEQLRKQMARNSRKMGEDLFNRDKTYIEIKNLIGTMIKK